MRRPPPAVSSFASRLALLACLAATVAVPGAAGDPPAERRGLSGRVLDPDGRPVAGVTVTVADADEPDAPELGPVVTDAEGRFHLPLRGGSYLVRALHRADSERWLALTWAGAEPGVDLRLARASESLELEVRDGAGTPVPRFLVRWRRGTKVTGAVRGTDGAITLPWHSAKGWQGAADQPGPAQVEVWAATTADGQALLAEPTRAGPLAHKTTHATVTLAAATPLAGRCVREDGTGVAGLRVEARLWPLRTKGAPPPEAGTFPSDDLVQTATTDADGRFALAALVADGRHLVRLLTPPTLLSVAPWLQTSAEERVVALRGAVEARVTLRTASGKPVPGAEVAATPPFQPRKEEESDERRPWWPDSGNRYAKSDERGEALLVCLDPAQRYRLRVDPPKSGDAFVTLDRTGWTPADTALTLEPLRALEGRVRDEAGRPVFHVQVLVHDLAGNRLDSATLGGDGRFRFAGLKAERVRLTAWRGSVWPRFPAPESARHSAVVDANARDVTLLLPRTRTAEVPIGVRLEWSGEADVDDVYSCVVLRREGERWVGAGSARYASAGSVFVADGLEAGERYAFWFDGAVWVANTDGRFGWAELTSLEKPPPIEFTQGQAIQVTLAGSGLSEGGAGVELHLSAPDIDVGTLRSHAQLTDGGRFEITGLRPGRYHVDVRQKDADGRVWRAVGDAEAGGRLELTLAREAAR